MHPYPMGFWNYTQTGQLQPKDVADWENCGMNLVLSPHYDPAVHQKQDLLALLDECQKRDIRMILCDARTLWHGASADEAAYRMQFAAALADFGDHPAVFGFHIGDEPRAEDEADCAAAYRIQLEMAPHLTPFLNHFPWHENINMLLDTTDYEQWLEQFIQKSGTKLLCYDCYSQMNPEEDGIEMYFHNLKVFSEAARATGVPLWTTLLSVGHFRYRCPSEDDLRWQISTAAASGCKGILWFFFYERTPYINYRHPPINEFWEKTSTYYDLSCTVRRFLGQHAQLLSQLTLDRSYHVGKAYGGYPIFEKGADPLVASLSGSDHAPLMLSVFRDKESREYCCVVNLSQKLNTFFQLDVRGENAQAYRYDFGGGTPLVTAQQDSSYHTGDGVISIGSWLAPGQMEIYRIEP